MTAVRMYANVGGRILGRGFKGGGRVAAALPTGQTSHSRVTHSPDSLTAESDSLTHSRLTHSVLVSRQPGRTTARARAPSPCSTPENTLQAHPSESPFSPVIPRTFKLLTYAPFPLDRIASRANPVQTSHLSPHFPLCGLEGISCH